MKNSRQRSGVWRGNSCLYKSFYFSGAIIECKNKDNNDVPFIISHTFVCFVGVVVGVIFMSRPNKLLQHPIKTKKDKEGKEDDTEGAVLGRRNLKIADRKRRGRCCRRRKRRGGSFEFEQPSVNTGSITGGGGTGTVPGEGLLPPPSYSYSYSSTYSYSYSYSSTSPTRTPSPSSSLGKMMMMI
ncbi:WSSV242 [White spot syndrome virus]|uniref:WSSV242 n=1 Tax=White spot syndrome virus TaxID=342409 RepID=A0A2I6SBW1_9VIRU|nr:WSSV242 [White spot syndrome virus]